MIAWGVVAGVLTGTVVLAFSGLLPHVFTEDAAVIALASFLLLHVGFSQPAAGVVFALDGVLIGAGDLRFLAVSMVGAGVVLVSGAVLVVAIGAGIGWLWAALHSWIAARLIMMLWRFKSDRWQITGADR